MDSPGSVLSDYASDDFPEDVKGRRLSFDSIHHTPDHDPSMRPVKRLRLAGDARRATSDPPTTQLPELDDGVVLSEDTDGSVPASPNHPSMTGDDDYGQEQVTVCKWEGCDAGDLGNMDKLVDHLHEDHIGVRQKKYSCEWSDCNRKGIPHASGYALRAHMRSHTREKPFYCTLPGKWIPPPMSRTVKLTTVVIQNVTVLSHAPMPLQNICVPFMKQRLCAPPIQSQNIIPQTLQTASSVSASSSIKA